MLISSNTGARIASILFCLLSAVNGRHGSQRPHRAQKSTAGSSTDGTIILSSNETTTLTSDGTTASIVVLDYDQSVEGFPTFEVISASGDTSSFEISFAESKAALDSYMVKSLLPSIPLNLITNEQLTRDRVMVLYLSRRRWTPTE